jgi:3',5'-cyclic-AMP phosphodiesterase
MTFSFVQITDHHLTTSEAEFVKGFSTRHAFRAVMRHIAQNIGAQADFMISTGDLVDRPSEASYQAFLQAYQVRNASTAAPGPFFVSADGFRDFPMYQLPGNHDDREVFYKCLFPNSQSMPLMNVAFQHKGVQFICLDWGPRPKAVAYPEMLDFLAQALETGLPSILIMHHHLVPIGSRWLDAFIADDIAQFWEIASRQTILGILCGHVHTTYEKVVNGIPIFGLRSTSFPFVLQDEPLGCLLPPHYRLVTVEDGALATQVFEVPL